MQPREGSVQVLEHVTLTTYIINDHIRGCRSPYTILYYTILHYTTLLYSILYYTILYYTILYYTITILYQRALNGRLPLTCHFCAEKWHLDLVCRNVTYLLPVMQGFSQLLAVTVLYVISSIAPIPSLQCYAATWFPDALGDVCKLWTACHAEKHVASQELCVLACCVKCCLSLLGAFRVPFVARK